MIKYFYIHGYNSDGIETSNRLKETLKKDIILLSYDSNKSFQDNFEKILNEIKNYKENKIIIATSLGCYYARAIAELEYAELRLFNPCFFSKLLNIIPKNISETYNFNFNFSKTIPTVIFVSKKDEVIKDNHLKIKEFYNYSKVILTEENHRILNFDKYSEEITENMFL